MHESWPVQLLIMMRISEVSLHSLPSHTSPHTSATDAITVVTAASQSATLLSMTINIASEMHVNALRSLTQPCLTANCIWCYIQAFYQALQISVSEIRSITETTYTVLAVPFNCLAAVWASFATAWPAVCGSLVCPALIVLPLRLYAHKHTQKHIQFDNLVYIINYYSTCTCV